MTVDTLNVVDSLSMGTIDSTKTSKVVQKEQEVDKVDYWSDEWGLQTSFLLSYSRDWFIIITLNLFRR